MPGLLASVLHLPGSYEPISSWLHLGMAVVILAYGWNAVRDSREQWERQCLRLYVLGAVGLFISSGAYHLLEPASSGRALMQRLDHAFIWVMIAGTITAVHGVAFRNAWRWGFLPVVWLMALAGLVLEGVFFRAIPEWLTLSLYLALGWMGVFSMIAVGRTHDWSFAREIAVGSVIYSAGAAYDFLRGPAWIPGVVEAHEVFHLAVVSAAVVHWRMVRRLMVGGGAGRAIPLFGRLERPVAAPGSGA